MSAWSPGRGTADQAVVSAIPNTDPRSAGFLTFQARQVAAVWPPALDMSGWARLWAPEALQDLDVTVANF